MSECLRKPIIFLFPALLLAPVFAGFQTAQAQSHDHFDESSDGRLLSELKVIVDKQAAAWNEADIDGFMQAYWNDERLTFSSGGTTERGWKKTSERYHSRYPTPEAMGKLEFSDLEVRGLGDSAALMLGKWKLTKKEPARGNFSLVWQKLNGVWLIVHDHSSLLSE